MKPDRITLKSSEVEDFFEEGAVLYRVMFEELPEYLKTAWLFEAEDFCTQEEIDNPQIEMEAVITKDGSIEDVCFKYYFDDYVEFALTDEDTERAKEQFLSFVKENGLDLPDAYDRETGTCMGDGEWLEAKYAYLESLKQAR